MPPVAITIFAVPGLPAKLASLALPSDDSQMHVVVSEVAGRLIIRHHGSGWPFVRREGVVSSVIALLEKELDGQPPWLTPEGIALDVEPGEYTVCPTLSLSENCITRVVAVGTTVTIDGTQWPESSPR